MTRAFVAIRPPSFVLDAVEQRVEHVAMPAGRRTPRDLWRITVQFLGDEVDIGPQGVQHEARARFALGS